MGNYKLCLIFFLREEKIISVFTHLALAQRCGGKVWEASLIFQHQVSLDIIQFFLPPSF